MTSCRSSPNDLILFFRLVSKNGPLDFEVEVQRIADHLVACSHAKVGRPAIEQRRIVDRRLKLGSHLANDVDALGLELLEVGQRVGRHACFLRVGAGS